MWAEQSALMRWLAVGTSSEQQRSCSCQVLMAYCKHGIFLSSLGWPLCCGLVKEVKQIFVGTQYLESNKFSSPISMMIVAFTVVA